MSKPKHIHILGICGTFMGGIAAIAKQAGYRVTGCDANVYPPMSTQLEAQGIELIEGFGVEQLELKPDVFVIGNVVSRGNPLMEEILNRNLPYASGPQWLADTLLRDKWVLGVAGTHGKTIDDFDAGVDTGTRGAESRLPDRRRAAELRHLGAHHRVAVLRHRGGRIRHRLLRQAFQVRALPSAHRDPEQPRIRPRRHLPRPRAPSRRSSTIWCAPCRATGWWCATGARNRWRA